MLMTPEFCGSGSERIASVAIGWWAALGGSLRRAGRSAARGKRLASTAVINVQGDQPFLEPDVVTAMVKEFGRCDPVPEVVTPVSA